MQITKNDIKCIKQTYKLLKDRNNDFSAYFYDCLFDFSPALKPMFISDRKKMQEHFMAMIAYCTENIDDFDTVSNTLINLGKSHKGYGVTAEQYALVKSAFMLSLQYYLREALDQKSEQAWSRYYDKIADVMISAYT